MGVLDCSNLNVRFKTEQGDLHVVRDFSLNLEKGECVGVVGESGSGKSQTFMAMLGLLTDNGQATGSVKLDGQEILNAPRALLNQVRGNRIGMIFQDPMSSLTPFLKVGEQMCEGLVHHQGLSTAQARARALETLELVRIPDAKRRFNQYPHELSGGMKQRVMIAQALMCKPAVLVADEPTTALDVTVQAQILEILEGLKSHTDTAIVMITHDLGVVAGICDRVLVMYAGRVVEEGPADNIFHHTHHPYTQGLLRSVPSFDLDPSQPLAAIPGQPPAPFALPSGCAFSPRCQYVSDACGQALPVLTQRGPQHRAACVREALS
ncbi:MAG: ABC transporter ATP-binding protein [Rhodospirillaceae bacterium]|nr:ABC transporter ATP-binding protein [Rhodospirillaceae bacterium]